MTTAMRCRSEATRLAELLGVEPAELEFLVELDDPVALRALSEQVTDVLFDAGSERLQRVAAAARLLPASLAASLAERAMGPVSCALLAGTVDRSKAVDIARRLRPEFLAEVAVHLDPRRVGGLVGALPSERILAAALALVDNDAHVTMGRLAASITEDALHRVVGAMSDADLLLTAFVLEDRTRLDGIAASLADERIISMVRVAHEDGLWLEGLSLIFHLGDEQRGRLGDLSIREDPAVVGALIEVAHEHLLWPTVLPLVRVVSEEPRRTLASLDPFRRVTVIDAVVDAAAEHDLWDAVVPIVPHLPARSRARVATRVDALPARARAAHRRAVAGS